MTQLLVLDPVTLQTVPVDATRLLRPVFVHGGVAQQVRIPPPKSNSGTGGASHLRGAWQLGTPFPDEPSECGSWVLRDYVAWLRDPEPCGKAGELLPWVLDSTSVCTVKLKDGRTRMYLPSPTLSQVTAGPSPIWPYADSAGIAKFGIEAGRRIEDLAGQMAWWRAGSHALAVTRVESLHFSSHFIAFMDSTDGLNWTLYAPKVPMEVDEHDECKQNADPIFEDGGFRAGWRSTSIRCSGSDVVYRDPSVIYLEKIDRYVMFVVECAAERSPPDYFVPVGDYVPPSAPPWAHAAAIDDNNRCQICLGECVLLDGTYVKFKTTTRVVFFVCSNPDFQHGVLGPFRASEDLQTASRLESDAEAEQPYAPKFIGVPQAFLDPDEANFFLFYANPTLPAGSTGMHVAPISAVARQVAQLERDWFQGGSARRAALNSDTFRQMLTVLGDPTPIVGNTYLITDQHFYFCNNHLQMMGGQNYVAQPNDPRLTELWQFSFTEEYVSQKIFLSGLPPSGFCSDPCSILDSSIFGTTQIPIREENTVIAFNDPWITTAQDGRLRAPKWVLYARCAAVGGLIHATTSTLTPGAGCPSCGSY